MLQLFSVPMWLTKKEQKEDVGSLETVFLKTDSLSLQPCNFFRPYPLCFSAFKQQYRNKLTNIEIKRFRLLVSLVSSNTDKLKYKLIPVYHQNSSPTSSCTSYSLPIQLINRPVQPSEGNKHVLIFSLVIV